MPGQCVPSQERSPGPTLGSRLVKICNGQTNSDLGPISSTSERHEKLGDSWFFRMRNPCWSLGRSGHSSSWRRTKTHGSFWDSQLQRTPSRIGNACISQCRLGIFADSLIFVQLDESITRRFPTKVVESLEQGFKTLCPIDLQVRKCSQIIAKAPEFVNVVSLSGNYEDIPCRQS